MTTYNLWHNITINPAEYIISEQGQLFIYDVYYKLFNNLNRVKQLQFFDIVKSATDIYENQWFLYKPRYTGLLKTDNNKTFKNNGTLGDIIVPDDIKATPETDVDKRRVGGELWVRLKNFPFAYPFQFNVSNTLSPEDRDELFASDIYDFEVVQDIGFIYYIYNEQRKICVFKIVDLINNSIYFTTGSEDPLLDISVLDSALYTYNNVPKTAIQALNKTCSIEFIRIMDLNGLQDYIKAFIKDYFIYIVYTSTSEGSAQPLKITVIDPNEIDLVSRSLSHTGAIELPKFAFAGQDILAPSNTPNWAVSLSADKLNIAYQTAKF